MNRRVLYALLAVALVAGAGAFVHHRRDRVWIGAILPLTGPDRSVGLGMRDSIRLAVEQINSRGGAGGHQVGVIELDDASQQSTAIAAAKQLVADPRVLGVIAHYDTDCAVATRPIFTNAALPDILGGVTGVEAQVGSETEFRLLPTPSTQMQQAFDYAWDTAGARRFLSLHQGLLGFTAFLRFNASLEARLGHRVIGGDVLIKAGATDFSEALTRVKNEDPQFIFFGGRAPEAAAFLKQLRGAGATVPVELETHYPSQEVIDLAGKSAEGAVEIFPGLPPQDFPLGQQYLADYQAARFSEPSGPYGIFAYAETQALLSALDKSFLNRASVTGALHREELQTALGPIRFNFSGSTYTGSALYQVRDGKWVPILSADAKGKLQPYPPK